MAEPDVIRTACEKIRACGKWYDCREAVNLCFKIVSEHPLTQENPGYHMPPIFYSGSPYGHIIAKLGAKEIPTPANAIPVFVGGAPHDLEWWQSRAWLEIWDEDGTARGL